MEKPSYVYMLANAPYGTVYIGVTTDLIKRVWQHKNKLADGFTKKYVVNQLVWYEVHQTVLAAITREKQLKKWNRAWKLDLISQQNPRLLDLYDDIIS